MAETKRCIGIRREDKNPWEARVPLVPSDIAELIKSHGLSFRIQPSTIRTYTDDEFRKAGAVVDEDLSPCDIILAVKEIPEELFAPDKTYMFFSHTIKGQKENMPMLKTMMERRTQLLDYEKITDHVGRRLIFFGRHAGLVGMINSLWILGRRLGHEGFETPFAGIHQALDYKNLAEAKQAVLRAGAAIVNEGLPKELGPLVVGFAGYGNVSRGAQEIFDLLPFERVMPEDLASLSCCADYTTNILYKVVFKEEDMVEPVVSNRVFVLQDYFDHPERYRSRFDLYLPHMTLLINAIYWEKRFPRLVTCDYLKRAQARNQLKLRVIGDITCDVNGSVQCNLHSTNSGNPVYVYNPATGRETGGVGGPGVAILATDNLPCELGTESSEAFSRVLVRFLPDIANARYNGYLEESGLPDELQRAAILWRGKLTPDFEYLARHLAESH